MNPLEYWNVNERVTVFQAALLALEIDPSNFASHSAFKQGEWPTGYGAIKTALIAAITDGRIEANIVHETHVRIGLVTGSPSKVIDIDRTLVSVKSLRAFFQERHFYSSLFNAMESAQPDYLNPKSDCYAPKLAAAVSAWIAVSSASDSRSKGTPKQRLESWLRANAKEYNLLDANGKVLNDAVGQIAKIANWRHGGGPPKRNDGAESQPSSPRARKRK